MCWYEKGSYTVEAAIVIPLLFCIFAFTMQKGIDFYKEIEQEIQMQEQDEQGAPWIIELFYLDQTLEQGLKKEE